MAEWRAGRSTGRTLWRDEVLVGMVDSPKLAAEIVETMNRVGALLDEVRGSIKGSPSTSTVEAEAMEGGRERSPDERPAECCCAGCIGMGPCDDDLGKSDEDDADDHPVDCGCAMCLQERDELFT